MSFMHEASRYARMTQIIHEKELESIFPQEMSLYPDQTDMFFLLQKHI